MADEPHPRWTDNFIGTVQLRYRWSAWGGDAPLQTGFINAANPAEAERRVREMVGPRLTIWVRRPND